MRMKIFFLVLLSVFCLNSLTAQKKDKKIKITGVVFDVAREPVKNAIVLIDGCKTNAMTDSRGHYKIRVKSAASRIGILAFANGVVEEDINGRARIDFHYSTSGQSPVRSIRPGEQGVNTGYSTIKQKNLTTDINKIDGTNKKYASYSSIGQMIEREVSGIRVSGEQVIIQDSRDLLGFIPAMIMVDGVYYGNELPDIPPTSVKSIEILKGTSSSIFGSRGAGGAILIKTRLDND
jgi:TonB-dependent SusC/RagA subfamily outer membrane receptor